MRWDIIIQHVIESYHIAIIHTFASTNCIYNCIYSFLLNEIKQIILLYVLNFSGLNHIRNAIISLIWTKYLKSYSHYIYNINSFVQIFALFYLNIRSVWLKNRKILPFFAEALTGGKKGEKWWAQKNSDCMKKFNKYWIYHLIYENIL